MGVQVATDALKEMENAKQSNSIPVNDKQLSSAYINSPVICSDLVLSRCSFVQLPIIVPKGLPVTVHRRLLPGI